MPGPRRWLPGHPHPPTGEPRGKKTATALEASSLSLATNLGCEGPQGLGLDTFMPGILTFTIWVGSASCSCLWMDLVSLLEEGKKMLHFPRDAGTQIHKPGSLK